jgi:hypothetical protein
MERRMAALFVLAVGLIAWQAPLTKPTPAPSSVRTTLKGEQLFPIAVPDAAPIPLPARFTEGNPGASQPARPTLTWKPDPDVPSNGACRLELRVSRYHWARRSLTPEALGRLAGAPFRLGETRFLHLAARDFSDDDDGDGDPLDAGELTAGPAGAEVEAECPIAAKSPNVGTRP